MPGWTPSLLDTFGRNLEKLREASAAFGGDRAARFVTTNEIRARYHILSMMIVTYGAHPHTTDEAIRQIVPKAVKL